MWIDTEFNEYRGALISMALVAENGSEWYGVRFCHDPGFWVREHVMPVLGQSPQQDEDLVQELRHFLAQFDACDIIADWPEDISHFCNFLVTGPGERIDTPPLSFEIQRDLPNTADISAVPHNALEDARALARAATANRKWCKPCRQTGMVHCSDPENCGGPWDSHVR